MSVCPLSVGSMTSYVSKKYASTYANRCVLGDATSWTGVCWGHDHMDRCVFGCSSVTIT